jgi:hypothetical protein
MSALIFSLGFLINSLRHYSNIKIGVISNEFPSLMMSNNTNGFAHIKEVDALF